MKITKNSKFWLIVFVLFVILSWSFGSFVSNKILNHVLDTRSTYTVVNNKTMDNVSYKCILDVLYYQDTKTNTIHRLRDINDLLVECKSVNLSYREYRARLKENE